jgi:nucleoside-diphosphate-sugar epimerase
MSEKVLLTGISGFVAKHVAIELLNSGYEVLGTVRNSNSIEQTKKTLEENNVAINNLSFVKLDLLKDEGWNEAANKSNFTKDKLLIATLFSSNVFFVCSIEFEFLTVPKTS